VPVSNGREVCMFVCLMYMYLSVQCNSTDRAFVLPVLISFQLLVFRKYCLRMK
jgi:hypothetical protein